MWRSVIWCAVFAVIAISAQAQAPYIPHQNIPQKCYPTPTIEGASGSYPGRERILRSNKLARPAGKAVLARGEILYVLGHAYDENCVPVEGASIELWQADTNGKYHWEKPGKLVSPDPAFAGTGQAFTNNLGEYQFLTVFPGVRGIRAPHLNLRITHPDFPTLNTEMFFEGDHRNGDDPRLNSLPSVQRDQLKARMTLPAPHNATSFLTAHFDIIMTGRNLFKKY